MMKADKTLEYISMAIICCMALTFVVQRNLPLRIRSVDGLEFCMMLKNIEPGDTIDFFSGPVILTDEKKRIFHYVDRDGRQVFIRDHPIGTYQTKKEFYVVENSRWRSQNRIHHAIEQFNAATISLDSVRKYAAGYSRFFLRGSRKMTRGYSYKENGDFVGSEDYDNHIITSYSWEIIVKEDGMRCPGNIGDSILVKGYCNEFCRLADRDSVMILLKKK